MKNITFPIVDYNPQDIFFPWEVEFQILNYNFE